MAVTVADFQVHLAAADTACGASDWTAARLALGQALILAVGLPRTTVDGASVDYSSKALDALAIVDALELSSLRGGNRLTTTRTAHGRRASRGRLGIDGRCGH